MADITLAPIFAPAFRMQRPAWINALTHRAEVLRRLARRNRYLAQTGRSARYPWIETMFASMSGR